MSDDAFRPNPPDEAWIPVNDWMQIGCVIAASAPTLERWLKTPPPGLRAKNIDGQLCYSAKEMRLFQRKRVLAIHEIIDPQCAPRQDYDSETLLALDCWAAEQLGFDLNPLVVALAPEPQPLLYRGNNTLSPATTTLEDQCLLAIENNLYAMEFEIGRYAADRFDSAREKELLKLQATARDFRTAIANCDFPEIRMRLQLAGLTQEKLEELFSICIDCADARLAKYEKAERKPGRDKFAKRLAVKWARRTLEDFGRRDLIAVTDGGAWPTVAALFYGDIREHKHMLHHCRVLA